MSELLRAHALRKSYQSGEQQLEVLVDLDLEVATGQMVAITGASGSGKSTLLHCLGGMDRADSGSIRILDTEIYNLASLELSLFRNRTIGFVFQFHHLLPEFTAMENVMMPLLLRRIAHEDASVEARQELAEVGLEARARHRPGELSGGEQQRTAIARALVGKPHLLLADEPTGNLDPHTGDAIGELIRKLHESHGLTSIIVTHNERLASICDVRYRLLDGKLFPHL